MKYFSIISIAAMVLAPSCNGTAVAPSALAGQWSHVRAAAEPPGFFQSFTLSVSDTTLSGTGTYQGEAGPSGTIDVTGFVSGSSVHLNFVFHQTLPATAPDYTGSFDGRATSANDLVGTSTINGGTPASQHFGRVTSP